MVLRVMAIYTYIIMYIDYAGETVYSLVHLHLKDVLEHLQTERYMQEAVSSMMGIEHGQI